MRARFRKAPEPKVGFVKMLKETASTMPACLVSTMKSSAAFRFWHSAQASSNSL